VFEVEPHPAAGLPGIAPSDEITPAELRLAARNHGMPLEALASDVTPAGLHYLLVHYDIPVVDESRWRLRVAGCVGRELSLSLADLRALPAVTIAVTLECAGNGRALLSPRPLSQPWLVEAIGTAEWTGVPVRALLAEAGAGSGAVEVAFRGIDRGIEGGEEQRYERSLSLEEARRDEVLLAYAMNGRPLPPQHGFPLRLVVPGWYGMTSVKWLDRITVLQTPFTGYQQARGYRMRQSPDEPGVPVTRMLPRSLMVPPGIPEFATRARTMALAACTVAGRAWSGYGAIARVEVSADGGASWSHARLGPQRSTWAWCAWEWPWEPPEPGEYELCCRASDSAGNTQPLEIPWNLGGYANNAVQRVPVTVTAAGP
jgi:DMSO/TMAO reductase YedYZ molybdopterin-dependent catalytic subunit